MPKKVTIRPPIDMVNVVARIHVEMVLAEARDQRKISTALLSMATPDECSEAIEHIEKLHDGLIVAIPEGDGTITIVF
jgi:hypothetical protein